MDYRHAARVRLSTGPRIFDLLQVVYNDTDNILHYEIICFVTHKGRIRSDATYTGRTGMEGGVETRSL